MKAFHSIIIAVALSSAVQVQAASGKKQIPVYKNAKAPVEQRVEDLLSRMTFEEKVLQLNQYVLGRNDNDNNIGEVVSKVPPELGSVIYINDNYAIRNAMQKRCMEETRLGIPMLFGYDVIHGFRTIFPIPLAQAASWNTELAGRAARVAALESYATGIDWTFSPMVDVARDPRWGRISEGYGEDPYTAARFCEAVVRGYQGEDLSAPGNIAACLKHYVGYGASEAGRDYVPTEISRQTLWDTYLTPFEAGVKAGAATLMSSFNNISGTPGSANRYTLTEVRKNIWKHEGFVVSDWDAVKQLINQGMAADGKEAAMLAFNAGLEMDMVDDLYRKHLPALVEEGKVSMADVDEAVRRVLRVKFLLGLFDNPYAPESTPEQRYLIPEYRSVALEAAVESAVLLKNNSILPLSRNSRIALVGPLADDAVNMLGRWAGRGRGEDCVSILSGMKSEFADVTCVRGCGLDSKEACNYEAAVAAVASADVAVVCLGEKNGWSGENASRSTTLLPEVQRGLLDAVAACGKPVVLLLGTGRPVDVTTMEPKADAIMEIWQLGVEEGNAVAGLLSGKYVPSGKLPVTFQYTDGQIPIYYNRRNSARRGTQGLYQDIQSTPMYEFGYGLSYTTFEYSPVSLSSSEVTEGGKITARVTVRNTGKADAKETVHWFITDPYSIITRPVKELRFFEKKLIRAGESVDFVFEIEPLRDLGFVDENGRKYVDKGLYHLSVGSSKVDINVR